MNGYMWFYAARAQAVSTRAASDPVRQHHTREPQRSARVAALGLLLPLATVATTYAAMTG